MKKDFQRGVRSVAVVFVAAGVRGAGGSDLALQ